MAFDGVLIASLAHELNEKLAGGRIDKIHQPEQDALVLHIKSPRDKFKLYISVNSNLPHMTLTDNRMENPLKPPMFCMLLRKHLSGGRIISISQHRLERIVFIDIESRNELGDITTKSLAIEIMGKHSNIILIEKESFKILDSIKRIPISVSRIRQILPGLQYEFIPSDKLYLLDSSENDFFNALESTQKPTKIFKWLYTTYEGFSPALARSLCAQAELHDDMDVLALGQSERSCLWNTLSDLKDHIKVGSYEPIIVKESSTGKYKDLFAVKPYHFLSSDFHIDYKSSITEVISEYYSKKDLVNRMHHKTQNLRKFLTQRLDRHLKKIQKLKEEQLYAENADESKIYGELLLANLYQLEKGMHEIKVLNYYDPDSPEITVNLDSRLTPSENAQKYFKKYNKLKTAQEKLAKQIDETESEIAYIEQVLTALDLSTDSNNVEDIRQELIETGLMKKRYLIKSKKKKAPEPIHYMSSDGFEILVGKNNIQNDYLTLKLASNKDIWLHTKIIPGSHVIIRTHGQDVPEQSIYEAACIAAWHSKGRLSSQVPVDYTPVKYVTKPNGAKPGMVIYTTNQTLYVTPVEEEIEKMRYQK